MVQWSISGALQSALGRISFTSDCWSDPNLTSFLALTAHFIARENGHLVLHNRLLAFRIIEGAHDGENLARIIFAILKDAGVLGKVCLTQLFSMNIANLCYSSENLRSTMPATTVLSWSGLRGCFVKWAFLSVTLEIVSSKILPLIRVTSPLIILSIQLLSPCHQYCGANYAQGIWRPSLWSSYPIVHFSFKFSRSHRVCGGPSYQAYL